MHEQFCIFSFAQHNSFRAQEVFKQALQTDEIRLRVLKTTPPLPKQPPPPLLPKPGKSRPLALSLPKEQEIMIGGGKWKKEMCQKR